MYAPLRSRLGLALGAVLVVLTPFGVPVSSLRAQEEGTRPAATGPCQEKLEAVRAVIRAIPENIGSVTPAEADAFARRVIAGLREGDGFLAECAGTAEAGEVQFYQARFLYLLSKRRQIEELRRIQSIKPLDPAAELQRAMAPFYERVAGHARAASTQLPKESELRDENLEVLGWAYTKLEDFPKARDTYIEHRKVFPKSSSATTIAIALARVYLDLGEHAKGIEIIESTLKDPDAYDSDDYPHLGEVQWKLYEQKGDIEGMLRCAENVLTVYPLRLQSSRLSAETRQAFERYIDVFGFRKAYAIFASGKLQDALSTFRWHVDRIDDKRAKLKSQGRDLEPVSSIYRERSLKCVEFIERLAERPAPDPLDLGPFWGTDRQLRLDQARGKVVAIVFRGVGDRRSAPFIEALDDFAVADERVELVAVSYLKGLKNVDQQLTALKDELIDLEYESAAGYDPDATGKRIFRAYGAYVGSATLVLVDARGFPVWYQQDPRSADVELAKSLIRRLTAR